MCMIQDRTPGAEAFYAIHEILGWIFCKIIEISNGERVLSLPALNLHRRSPRSYTVLLLCTKTV